MICLIDNKFLAGWHWNLAFNFEFGLTHFNIRNPVLTFEFRPNIAFDIRYPILSFSLGRISHFDIRNHIMTFELGPNISF